MVRSVSGLPPIIIVAIMEFSHIGSSSVILALASIPIT